MLLKPEYQIGDSVTVQKMITYDDTAVSFGNGGLDNLLATPSLAAMIIEASSKLLDKRLHMDYTSAGLEIFIKHLCPSPIGNTVTVKVTISEIQEQIISLEVEAADEMGPIAVGTHKRIIVSKEGIQARAASRSI